MQSLNCQRLKFSFMKNNLLLGFLILISVSCLSQSRQDTVALIERAMIRYLPQNPGCQLSIKRNGEIIFSKAYGMADLEHNIPLTLTSKIEAGSVSKQFTAAAILILEQQGKLSLNDDIRKYLPEIPDYGVAIKLEQLMHHTSGLRDWGSVAALSGWGRTTKTYTNEDALEIIAAQKSLNNKPGAEFIYSNSNYNLLAIIVQRVSGLSLAAFTKKYIFEPAGMQNTEWRDNHKRIVPNRAMAYSITANGYETEMPNEDVYGNGGLLTTTEDLLKWNDFYTAGKLGTGSLLSKQKELVPLSNSAFNDYGAGLFIGQLEGLTFINHSGATAGYRANLEVFPDIKFSIAFLSNTSQFDTANFSVINTLNQLFFADLQGHQRENENAATKQITVARLNSYAGWYVSDKDGSGIQLEVKDKNLMLGNLPLNAITEGSFLVGSTTRSKIEINEATGLLFIRPGSDTTHYLKADAASSSSNQLAFYEGKYFSTETNSTITVFQKDNQLFLHLKPNTEFQLKATYKDGFDIPGLGGNLYFIKDRKHNMTTMKVSISRARNIEYSKLY